jgi:anti-anti-sigma factor
MLDMKTSKSDNEIILSFEGEINSTNAEGGEKEVFEALGSNPPEQVTFNFKDLTYISSAGLRILLKVKQACPSLKLVEVTNEVYSVLEMTGFVTMITVDRALTEIDITGCEKIGDGYTCEV